MISVIIPVFEQTEFLLEAVQSALNQPDVTEVVVVDDGNPPNIQRQIAELMSLDRRVHVLRHLHNKGRSAARNAGIDQARGQYLLFLDADDVLSAGFTAHALHFLESNPDWAGVWGSCELIGNPSAFTQRYFQHQQRKLPQLPANHPLLFSAFCPPIHCVLVKRTFVVHHRFPTEISYGEDRIFWLQLKDSGSRFMSIPYHAGFYRIRENNPAGDFTAFLSVLVRHHSRHNRAYGHAMRSLYYFNSQKNTAGVLALLSAIGMHPTVAINTFIRIFSIKFLNF